MSDYGTMRSRIADEMANDGDITSAQINYAIQDTIKVYERKPWWFNWKTGTLTTVADQEYYTSADLSDLPDLVEILSATVTYNGIKSPMMAVDYPTIDSEQSGVIKGIPRLYAYFAEQLRIYPIPIGAYTITLSYVYRLAALSADGDTNAWTTDAEELVRQGAKRRIALNYLNSEDLAARYVPLEREAYAEMMAENRRRWPNTMLRPPAMLARKYFNIIRG